VSALAARTHAAHVAVVSARARRVLLTLAIATVVLGAAWLGRAWLLERVVRARHPEVATVDADTLASWLAAPNPPRILDVRSVEEHAVSHLEGAQRVEPGALDPASIERLVLDRDARIVVYCSVGVRSSDLAAALNRAGHRHVYDLEGGLFAWANAGRPVVGEGAPRVHPYDSTWSLFVRPELRAPIE
jgi:rhodanese-related sulfurtransferase